jgi:hypothetical protein
MKGIQLSTVASNLSRYFVTKNHEIFFKNDHISINSHHIFTLNSWKVIPDVYLNYTS